VRPTGRIGGTAAKGGTVGQPYPVTRRTVLAAAAGAALTGLTACGGRQGGTADEPRAGTLAYLDAGVPPAAGDGFKIGTATIAGAQATVVVSDPIDGAKGSAAFNDLATKKFDLIAVASTYPEQLVDSMSAAAAKGTSLITVDVPGLEGSGASLHVGSDNVALGALLAGQVIDRLPANATGQVVLGTPRPGVPPLDSRIRGIRETFQKRLPKVEILGPLDSSDVYNGAGNTTWNKIVAANPDAIAFLGAGYSDGPSLVRIRRKQHATWLVGGFDLLPATLEGVRSGDLLLVSPEHALLGAVAGRIAADHVRNGTALPTGWIPVPGIVVTPANVAQITARQDPAKLKAWAEKKLGEIFADGVPATRPLAEAT
jgi:ribose transport system substrate-binding protein